MIFNSKFKKNSCAVVLAMALLPATSAHAAMGGMQTWKEYFSFHAAVGWGTLGIAQVAAVTFTGGSNQEVTTASIRALCGTAAAGVFGKWHPDEPGTSTLSHVAGVAKGGAVVTVSTMCGWLSDGVYAVVNRNAVIAERNYQALQAAAKRNANFDLVAANNTAAVMVNATDDLKVGWSRYTKANIQYNDNLCGVPQRSNTAICVSLRKEMNAASALTDRYIAIINANGRLLHDELGNLKADLNV